MTKDLNQLAKEIYEANKAKGFHEEKHSKEHLFCLAISELMEAVEADRKGRKADFENFNKQHEYSFKDNFDEYIKDTVEDELADAFIRLLDASVALGFRVSSKEIMEIYSILDTEAIVSLKFSELIYLIVTGMIERTASGHNGCSSVEYVLALIMEYCKLKGIDLNKHIELKLRYNSLRPHKHGKAY